MIKNNMPEQITQLQKQIQEIKLQMLLQGQAVNYGIDFANLTNMIEVVNTAPTETPTTVYGQIKIHYNSTGPVWKLYLYDNLNSVWKSVTLS